MCSAVSGCFCEFAHSHPGCGGTNGGTNNGAHGTGDQAR